MLLRRWLPRVVLVVVVGYAVWKVVENWAKLSDAVDRVGAPSVVLSLVLAIAGTLCTQRMWASLLTGFGVHVPRRDAFGMFFVTQLGKYIPGSVWPALAQMEFGRRSRINPRTMLVSNLMTIAIMAGTGLITGAVLLPWTSSEGLSSYWWTLLLLIPFLACLHPKVLTALLNRLFTLVRQPPLDSAPTGRSLALAVAWGFASWVLLGLHIFVMVRRLGAGSGTDLVMSIGGMALAFAVGLIVIPAPAGAGPRDAILKVTFAAAIGGTTALAIALASRVLFIVGDLILAGVGALVRGRPSAVATSPGPSAAAAAGSAPAGSASAGSPVEPTA